MFSRSFPNLEKHIDSLGLGQPRTKESVRAIRLLKVVEYFDDLLHLFHVNARTALHYSLAPGAGFCQSLIVSTLGGAVSALTFSSKRQLDATA